MDPRRIDPAHDDSAALPAEIARFGAAGLSLRLTSLQQKLERDFPLSLALDITDREAVDGLPTGLTAVLHAMLQEAALAAAAHAGATLIRIAVHVGENSVLLRVADDGAGAFKGNYDLGELLAYGVGPQPLAQLVAAQGGHLRLDTRVMGCRVEIVVPRDPAALIEAAILPSRAIAAAG